MKQSLSLFLFLLFFTSCKQNISSTSVKSNDYNIIPLPSSLEEAKGQFAISDQVLLFTDTQNNEFTIVTKQLQAQLKDLSGFSISTTDKKAEKDIIVIRQDKNIANPEGYRLSVSPYDVLIEAAEPAGAFYAVQTLLQLLSKDEKSGKYSFACAKITDSPRYVYRGMHLDVARHFFPTSFIKKYIDLLAMHKMNRFHWHLTEDQGWRIEIKQYPKLQEVAAFRKETLVGHYSDKPHQFDGKPYGGFYTQDEVREIVAYAKERFITVIPEIELPGHSLAALTAYPELGCTNGPFEVGTKWGVFEDVYCPKEETFTFLQNVLTEVMDLFPSEYIHIGGDECPKTAWKNSAFCQKLIKEKGLKDEHELQSYFISRIEKFINSKGRQIIGWDEILEGGLAPNATVMSWRGVSGGIEAARQGHDVIMTPGSHCYFDHYQSKSDEEPLAIGGFLPLEKVYQFEPTPAELTAEEAKHVLGAQGNVWTEYIKTPEQAEYMAYPRAIALAEVNWSPKEARNYHDFTKRLSHHLKRLDHYNVNYANHLFEVKTDVKSAKKGLEVTLSTLAKDGKIYYSLDGSVPGTNATAYEKPIPLTESATLKASCYRNGKLLSRVNSSTFNLHKAAAKNITLTSPPHPNYSLGGKTALINGIIGSNERYGDGEWLGWSGNDFETIIDLGTSQKVKEINMRFYNGIGQWIYLPKDVEISVSDDGKVFRSMKQQKVPSRTTEKVVPVKLSLADTKTQFLKIKATNHGIIAAGQQGAGHEAWLFVDEIVVK